MVQGLVEKLEDRDQGRGCADVGEVAYNGKEHGHGPEPRCDETDGYRAHNGDWNHWCYSLAH